jgi:hypothetical protein
MAGVTWVRRAPLISAVAFAALVVAGVIFLGAGSPNNDAPGAEIAKFYNAHEGRVLLGAWLFTLSTVPLLFFVTSVRAAIRRAEGDRHLATAALAGGIAGIALLVACNAATMAAAMRVSFDKGVLDAQSAQTLWDLSSAFYVLSGVPMAVLVAAVAVAALHRALLPRWLSIVSLVIALGLAIPFVAWAVYLLFVLWVVAVGAVLNRRAGLEEPVVRPTAAATPA